MLTAGKMPPLPKAVLFAPSLGQTFLVNWVEHDWPWFNILCYFNKTLFPKIQCFHFKHTHSGDKRLSWLEGFNVVRTLAVLIITQALGSSTINLICADHLIISKSKLWPKSTESRKRGPLRLLFCIQKVLTTESLSFIWRMVGLKRRLCMGSSEMNWLISKS